MADSLVWMIVKNHNSFQQKRNGRTKRTGTVTLSSEPGNLMNTNSFKYSGLANSKVVKMVYSEEGDDKKPKVTLALKVRLNYFPVFLSAVDLAFRSLLTIRPDPPFAEKGRQDHPSHCILGHPIE